MTQYDKIKKEIQQIERELMELRQKAGQSRERSSLYNLNMRNERIKTAFKSLSNTISV